MNIRVLIVDDEPPGVKAIRNFLEREEDVEIVGECFNGPEAVEAIRRLRPELVFLDIQMPGLDGFEVLEELSPEEMPLVVFVTAYDQYSLQAFAVHAVDYLLKPPANSELREALGRARILLEGLKHKEASHRLRSLLAEVETHRTCFHRFVVREGDRVIFVKVQDVEAIEATGNYMHLYVGRSSFMIRETMANLEEKLDPAHFIRTHRSWMVNAEKIQKVEPWSRGVYLITVQGGAQAPVSRFYREGIDHLIRGPLARKS